MIDFARQSDGRLTLTFQGNLAKAPVSKQKSHDRLLNIFQFTQ